MKTNLEKLEDDIDVIFGKHTEEEFEMLETFFNNRTRKAILKEIDEKYPVAHYTKIPLVENIKELIKKRIR